MTIEQQTEFQRFTELPIRLYSALRSIRIYPPSNPQVTKSTDHVIAILDKLLEREVTDITIASSEQKILVNGNLLPEKDQQRPQIQGLAELFSTLQIHTLTFHSGFSAADCVNFLELLSAATGNMQPEQSIKILLQEAGIDSVKVDEKRYVAVHEGEQVIHEDNIGSGESGLRISDDDLAMFILGKTTGSGEVGGLSTVALQQLLTGTGNEHSSSHQHLGGQGALKALLDGLSHTASQSKKAELLDHSATALAGLAPAVLTRLLNSLPREDAADELLAQTAERMDHNQLEALLLVLSEPPATDGADGQSKESGQSEDIIVQLRKTGRAEEIEKTTARINDAKALTELSQQPTPQHLQQQLQQPEWSAPVLVTALRQLCAQQQKNPSPEALTMLLARYEQDLSPAVCNQVATQAGASLTTLQDQELGRILVQRFKGIFGEQLYGTVIAQMSDKQFEGIAQELNFLAQKKHTSPPTALDDAELQAAYQRFMQTVRGEKLRTVLAMHQEQQDKEQQVNKEQRLENIKLILAGDYAVLADDLVVQTLPSSVISLLQHDKTKAADKLLIQMVTGLQQDDTAIRKGSAEALGRTAADLVQAREWLRLEKLLPAIKQALPFMENQQASSQALSALEQLTHHHLVQKEYNRAINALNVLFEPTIHPTDNNPNLSDQAQTCLGRLADPALLGSLLENIQTDSQYRDNCWYLISRMGAGAANFLMGRLGESESREERELLLKLIEDIGKPARDALLHLLALESPWYVTRNTIRLLKNVGDSDCFAKIAPFLHHKDLRVQLEVVQTLGAIGGTARKNFFLQELGTAPDELKPLIIRQLGNIYDESIVLPLTDLLQSSAGPPHQRKEQLQVEICVALARLGSKKALPGLKKVVQTKGIPGIEDYSPKALAAAENALNAISSDSKAVTSSGQQSETVPHTRVTRKHDPLADKEASIFRKAGRGETEQAKKELYDLVIACAEKHDFSNAERLRERIYEIDPMALTEIIRSGEIIEKEKTGAVSRDQLDTWRKLLEKLNSVEFSAIYHEMKERVFAPEEVIVWQGEKNEELYFINHGSIKISYNKDGREIFVSSLNSGQIIGENFFDASFWTVTLTAMTPVRISVLKWESFRRWHEEYPGLEAKLQSFYNECNKTHQLLEKKRLDRRDHERFKLSRKVQIQLTDHNNNPIGRGFRGELADISKGGLAFLIRISKKENTRLLLGRSMRITIPVGGDPGHLQLYGLAIGVQPFQLLESDFSVHIKFPDILDQDILQQILG